MSTPGARLVGPGRAALWQFGLGRDNGLMFWACLLNEGSVGAYIALWPLYLTALGATPVEIGLVIGSGGAVYLGAVLAGGWLADRVSTRRLLALSRSLAVIGLVWCCLATEWWQAAPGRWLVSFSGLAWPVAAKVIAANVDSESARLRAFTLIFTVGPSAALLLTPALGGQLAESAGIRAALWFGVVLVTVSAVCFAAVRAAASMPHEQASGSYRQALALPAVRRLAALTLATGVAIQLANAFLPKFLQDVHGVGVGGIGLLDSTKAVGAVLLGLVAGRLKRSGNPLAAVAAALALVGAGLSLILAADVYGMFMVGYMLLGGVWLIFSSYYAAMGEAAPEALRARAFAFVELGIGLGVSLGPLIAGFLYGAQPRAPIVVAVAAVVTVSATLVWLIRRGDRRGASAE